MRDQMATDEDLMAAKFDQIVSDADQITTSSVGWRLAVMGRAGVGRMERQDVGSLGESRADFVALVFSQILHWADDGDAAEGT